MLVPEVGKNRGLGALIEDAYQEEQEKGIICCLILALPLRK
ncbi:hypothetical protein GCM10025794_27900 [Massilia kyonggiensis]